MKEERSAVDYGRELGFGKYMGKKLYELVVTTAGLVGGLWGGIAAATALLKPAKGEQVLMPPKWLKAIPGFGKGVTIRQAQWGGGVGAFLGSLGAAIVLGYEHWQKVKREQMQVDEITKDVSSIELFKKTDPELKAENERLWAELNGRMAGRGTSPRIAEPSAKSEGEGWAAHVQESKDATQLHEAAR